MISRHKYVVRCILVYSVFLKKMWCDEWHLSSAPPHVSLLSDDGSSTCCSFLHCPLSSPTCTFAGIATSTASECLGLFWFLKPFRIWVLKPVWIWVHKRTNLRTSLSMCLVSHLQHTKARLHASQCVFSVILGVTNISFFGNVISIKIGFAKVIPNMH